MNAISRRQWSAAGLGLLASRARGAAHFTHPLGAELYTVRNVMPTAADQTLKSIAEIGYREVEPLISPPGDDGGANNDNKNNNNYVRAVRTGS